MRNLKELTLSLTVLGLLPTLATAIPITGNLAIGGSATVTAVSLDFICALGGCPGTAGDFTVGAPATVTGDFAALGNTRGFIKDISETGGQPLNTNFSLAQWISFVANPNLFLDLNFIPLGQATASTTCVGVTFCTPIIGALVGTPNNATGLSAFNLGPGSASFEVRGIGYNTSSATGSTPYIGRFSADFPGLSAADIVTLFQNPGITNKAYSAAFTLAAVPEPGSGMLMLAGALLVASGSIRRRLRSRGTSTKIG